MITVFVSVIPMERAGQELLCCLCTKLYFWQYCNLPK